MNKKYLNKFYKKNHAEKIHALRTSGAISEEDFKHLKNGTLNLANDVANEMIENYITNYELPFGVAMNFIVNKQELLIPMVTEEPSVLAAASNAAKIVSYSGGFHTEMNKRLVIGQIVLSDLINSQEASQKIKNHEQEILQSANAAYPSLANYGGGARRIEVRILPADAEYSTPEFLIIHLFVDTGEAMGANIVNTMTEATSFYIEDLVEGTSLINILSNYSTESMATATCSIEPKYLVTSALDGETVRDQIITASQLAIVDPYRAVTHNKGIMNGIDAVLVATGNDWRAVEAGVHAYATKSGQYRSLTSWTKETNGNLKGEINIPISVGSVGGTLSIHPTAQFAYRLLKEPSAKGLSQIIATVGLAQNLAAIRALVTEGIQKGHMNLQARSLAIRVGAEGKNIDLVTKQLQQEKHINTQTAKKILDNILAKTQDP